MVETGGNIVFSDLSANSEEFESVWQNSTLLKILNSIEFRLCTSCLCAFAPLCVCCTSVQGWSAFGIEFEP